MNYDDLPLEVLRDLWLIRYGREVEFETLVRDHYVERAHDNDTNTFPSRVFEILRDSHCIESTRNDRGVHVVYLKEIPP